MATFGERIPAGVRRFIDGRRLYTQLDISSKGPIAASRLANKSKDFHEEGGHVESTSVTAEEVLEQANKIFAPYTLKFASTVSWFTVWKSKVDSDLTMSTNAVVSERVARSFSSPDNRVHLTGDAA